MTVTIVWLDTNATEPISSFRTKLGEAVIFTNPDDCIQYIQSHPNESIYLIASGSLGKLVVPEVYHLSNVTQISLYCGSVVAYVEWACDYCDKMLIFDHGDDLLERLWNDLERELRQQGQLFLKRADEFKQRAIRYRQPCG